MPFHCLAVTCSGVCIVNPAPTQRIMERDELIMMRPTAIGKNAYRGSPVPVAEVDISECVAVACEFACVTLMASKSKHHIAHSLQYDLADFRRAVAVICRQLAGFAVCVPQLRPCRGAGYRAHQQVRFKGRCRRSMLGRVMHSVRHPCRFTALQECQPQRCWLARLCWESQARMSHSTFMHLSPTCAAGWPSRVVRCRL